VRLLFCSILFVLTAVGCETSIQTTSGQEYLDRSVALDANDFTASEEFQRAAAVEPLLTFPARIGVARLENGQLTDIPAAEIDEWEQALAPIAADYGEFVPVNLFIADLVAPGGNASRTAYGRYRAELRQNAIRKIRLGAARQHLDAVIVYESYAASDSKKTQLALADLTLIGAYLTPSRKINATGAAAALLFDVRNGYPYGATTVSVEDDKRSTAFSENDTKTSLEDLVKAQAVAKLAGEIATDMLPRLKTELAAPEAPPAGG